MRTIYSLASLVLFTFIIGCSTTKDCCTIKSMSANFYIKNGIGTDMLNTKLKGSLTNDSIKVYYQNDDSSYTLFFNKNLDRSGGFAINKPSNKDGQYTLTLDFSEKTDLQDISHLLLLLGNHKPDTLAAQLYKNGSSTVLKTIWIAGKSVSVDTINTIKY